MDLSKIDDIEKLKALAYDQLTLQQQATRNLQMIEARIAELMKIINDKAGNLDSSKAAKETADSLVAVS